MCYLYVLPVCGTGNMLWLQVHAERTSTTTKHSHRFVKYLTGRAAGGTVSEVTSDCAAPWPCAAGRMCPGSVLGAPEIPPLLVDWSKENNKLHYERQGYQHYRFSNFTKCKLKSQTTSQCISQ